MTRNADMIGGLEALSRLRALTLGESLRLERLLRAEGLIPPAVKGVCPGGHPITGDNAMPHKGGAVCRKCAYASRRQSQARIRGKA